MGKIADALKKKQPKKRRVATKLPEREKKVANSYEKIHKQQYSYEQLSLLPQDRRRQEHFALLNYENQLRTCRWCCRLMDWKYDLIFGNRYTKCAYDSEDCQKSDAIMRGWSLNRIEMEDDLES